MIERDEAGVWVYPENPICPPELVEIAARCYMTEEERLNLVNDLAAAIEQLAQALRRLGCIVTDTGIDPQPKDDHLQAYPGKPLGASKAQVCSIDYDWRQSPTADGSTAE